MTAALALLFGKAFGPSPEYWMNLQANYDLETAARALSSRLGSVPQLVTG